MASVQNTLDRLNTWERFAFAYYAYVARVFFLYGRQYMRRKNKKRFRQCISFTVR